MVVAGGDREVCSWTGEQSGSGGLLCERWLQEESAICKGLASLEVSSCEMYFELF